MRCAWRWEWETLISTLGPCGQRLEACISIVRLSADADPLGIREVTPNFKPFSLFPHRHQCYNSDGWWRERTFLFLLAVLGWGWDWDGNLENSCSGFHPNQASLELAELQFKCCLNT
jgi:hypothetical protein